MPNTFIFDMKKAKSLTWYLYEATFIQFLKIMVVTISFPSTNITNEYYKMKGNENNFG